MIRLLKCLIVPVLFLAALPFVAAMASAGPGPIEFAEAQLKIEINATDGDAGLQVIVDGEPWRRLEVRAPNGRPILDYRNVNRLRTWGLTELFAESAEPNFSEVPLAEFKQRFPEGTYTFRATTIDNVTMLGSFDFSHDLPDAPVVVAPVAGAVVDATDGVLFEWEPVTTPAGLEVENYELIVGTDETSLSVELPAESTSFHIPTSFFDVGGDVKWEILVVAAESGNQVITETSFTLAG